jgi:hypothetical protein
MATTIKTPIHIGAVGGGHRGAPVGNHNAQGGGRKGLSNKLTGGLIGGKNVDVASYKATVIPMAVMGAAAYGALAMAKGDNIGDALKFAGVGAAAAGGGAAAGRYLRGKTAKAMGKDTNTVAWTGRANHKSK